MFKTSVHKAQRTAGLILLGTSCLLAQTTKKQAPPPSKPAPAPARSAPSPARPAGNTGTTTTSHAGPTTSGSSTSITTANRPAANRTSTTKPAPTANGGGSHPSTSGTGGVARPARGLAESDVRDRVRLAPAAHPTIDHGHPMPHGVQAHELQGGNAIARRPGGGLRDVHDARRGMDVHHELAGGRRVSVLRADHSRIVAERGRSGFIERPYGFHGSNFTRRTFYDHGRAYDRFYRDYVFHGVGIHIYAPLRYYPVGFYGWAYYPWGTPVVYAWGWSQSSWVRYYGFYFTPFPVYASPSLWLTNYMISNDLQTSYEAGVEAGTQRQYPEAASMTPMLSPEVKAQIAEEVKNQIALENTEAAQHGTLDPGSSGIARMLSDGHAHVFVAGSALDVVDATGTECALSDGDALASQMPPGPDDTTATLTVLASKGGNECARSATVTVALDDLQEMQNHMRETIDRGLEQLQQNQGKNGIPAAPPSAITPPTTLPFAALAPPPDPGGAAEINQQLQEADQSAQEVTAQEKQEAGTSKTP